MQLPIIILMWAPFVFALGVLAYASIFDFRKREVSNLLWLFAYPIGCALTLVGLVFNFLNIGAVLVSLGVSLFLGFALLYTGFYGGADVKALIFVGLTLPMLPLTVNPVLGVPALPLVLVVFCNSALLSLIWPLAVFILNLKTILRGPSLFEGIKLTMREKVLLLFTARRIPLEELEHKGLRYFPAETVVLQEGKPTRKLLHLIKAETNPAKYTDKLKENKELYKKGALASPTIPSSFFFTVALLVAPLGNIVFWIAILFRAT
jgi:Flp pilus assembly protein protease CpaA